MDSEGLSNSSARHSAVRAVENPSHAGQFSQEAPSSVVPARDLRPPTYSGKSGVDGVCGMSFDANVESGSRSTTAVVISARSLTPSSPFV